MNSFRLLLLCIVLVSSARAALENESARRDHLKRLRGAITAYGLLHEGKPPARLADLLDENLLDGPGDLLRPGSTSAAPARANLEDRAEYTLEALASVADGVIREKVPLPGEADVLVAFKDGSIKPLTAGPPAAVRPETNVVTPRPPFERPPITPTPVPVTEPMTTPAPTTSGPLPPPSGIESLPAVGITSLADGQTALNAGRVLEARGLFAAVARANPNSVEAWIGLGRCANLLGRFDEGIGAYEAVYRLAPDTPNLRPWIAELYLAKRDLGTARRWIDAELQAQPNSGWAWSWLATVQMESGQHRDARKSVDQVIRLQQGASAHRYQNGTGLLAYNQPERAIPDFLIALLIDPRGTGAQYQLGECYLLLGRKELAAEYFKTYLRSDATSEVAEKARQHLARLSAEIRRR